MLTEARLLLWLQVGRRTLPLPPQIPAHSISTARNMWWILSFTLAKTMGFPVSNFYPNQMAWMYHTRGPGQVWASSTTHSVHFYLHVKGFSDCHPFIAVGFLSALCWRQLLSSYQQPGANRVKAVILENWMQRVKLCTLFVCIREIHSFLFKSEHTREFQSCHNIKDKHVLWKLYTCGQRK